MSFLVPDTSTQLDNMLAKRDSLTEKIKDLGGTAITVNKAKIDDHKKAVVELVRENTEIEVVLAGL